MARLGDIVFDCDHPATLARFWAAVVDGYRVAPYDDVELARLRTLGVDDPEDDPTVLVEAGDDRPRMWFQRVSEAKAVKNRVHVDLFCDDITVERDRLVALGATVWGAAGSDGAGVLLHDPEGNEFCLFS